MNAAFHATSFRLALFTIIEDTFVRLTSLKGIDSVGLPHSSGCLCIPPYGPDWPNGQTVCGM